MKKIIGWFKNILMRILEVIDYMVKKDNEIELAKLEVKREIAKDVFRATSVTLSKRNVRFILACTTLSLGVGLGCGLFYTCFHDLDASQNILAN